MMNSNKPKISVLMAVYNGGEYLRRSIQSILDQTFIDFELLIINDCSTDNSLELIQSYQDDRIRIHTNEQNMGQSRSLNKGLTIARGKYIARIDADDFAFPEWLSQQYAFLEQNPDFAVVSAKAVVIDENDRIRRIYDSPSSRGDIILRALTFSPINHVGSVFNNETVRKHDGYVESFKIAADYGLWSKLICGGHRITSNQNILMAIRAHSSSLSQSASGNQELMDLSNIMKGNINKFTDLQINEDESLLLCKAFFDEGALSDIDFIQALDILRNVYGKLNPTWMIEEKRAKHWLKNRHLAAYLRRILYFRNQQDFTTVRTTLRRGVDDFGYFSPLAVLFVADAMGKTFLNAALAFYEQILAVKANVKTKNRLETVGTL